MTFRAVAAQTHASLSSVVRWNQAYQKRGRGGLRSKRTPGRPSRLSLVEKRELIQILSKGPLEAGYLTQAWTLPRIGAVIQKRFRIHYSNSNLWYLMQNLGWSCQKPTKKAKERREAEIRYWKHHVWPHIKKGHSAWSPLGLPG